MSKNHDAGSVDLVLTMMDGTQVGVTVEPMMVPVMVFLTLKHWPFTDRFLQKEDRVVGLVDEALPKVQILKKVELRDPTFELMGMEEFMARSNGTHSEDKSDMPPILQLLSKLGARVERVKDEEPPKGKLN